MIEVNNLSVSFGDEQILRNVSVALEPGQVVGLVGPNGAGKSTLLNAIVGLISDVEGEVRLNGKPLAGWSLQELARVRAYLPQQPEVHWPLSVRDVVRLGRLPHLGGVGRAFGGRMETDDQIVDAALARMELGQLAHRRMDQLSGGERMRVMLARMLAQETPCILLDEPTAGLDPYFQLEVLEVLADEAGEGKSVVVVLHDLSLAARFCDQLLLLRDGELKFTGAPHEVLTQEIVAEIYKVGAKLDHDVVPPLVVPVDRL